MGSTLAVEREWSKALCCGDSAALAATNSGAFSLQTVDGKLKLEILQALFDLHPTTLECIVHNRQQAQARSPAGALNPQPQPWVEFSRAT